MSATGPFARSAHDWADEPERSNPLALRLMCWIALACGRPVARLLLHAISAYFLLCSPGPRRQARRYLERALERPAGWGDLYRLFYRFAATVLDRVYLLRGRIGIFDLQVHGELLFGDNAAANNRGAFLVGAHVGSFEALSAIGRHVAHARVAMVMYPDNARMINAALEAIAPEAMPRIIPLGRPDSMLAIRDWLDDGGMAGMLGDRVVPGASERAGVLRLPFLGHTAEFSDGPFRLAALLRRRVVFMAALYEGGARYAAHFEQLADFSERIADPAERERRIAAATLAYVARLESVCRAYPYNWFNFHDFWREDEI